jgi:hypothetical protein
MTAARKRVWLFAILLAALLGLRAISRMWLGGARPEPTQAAAAPSDSPDGISALTAVGAPVPVAVGPASSNISGQMSESAVRQAKILDQILASKNDDDPRLDSDLRHLDEESKTVFRAKYRALPPEKHNERGTIVFLLGRNLTTAQDYSFLKEVLSEPPCLGVTDCSKPTESGASDDHQSNATAIVLLYPQLTALKALQKSPPATELAPGIREAALAAVSAARASRSTLVSQYAEKLGH